MYNIHNHYNNIYSLARSIIAEPSLVHLHPFGSSSTENLEIIGNPDNFPEDSATITWMYPIPGLYPRSGPILFCYDQEPLIPDFNRDLFGEIDVRYRWGDKTLPAGQGSFDQNIILLNTELDSDAKDSIIQEHGFIDCYYFHHAFAASDWFRGYQYLTDLRSVGERTLKKKFITFNRITSNARVYRSLLINELIEHDLVHQGHISFSRECPDGSNFATELKINATQFAIPDSLVSRTIDNIQNIDADFRIDHKQDHYIPNNSFHISAIAENMESFVHVVTETCYWGRKKHLTEKIFKPIVMRQPFVLVGCAHNLEYFKSYGFKTFDRWWDESYDEIEDDVERIHAIGTLLSDICKNDLIRLTEILYEMEEVLDHNYRWFYNQEFIDNCWDELATNLRSAIKSKPLPYTYLQIDPRLIGR